MIDKQYAKVVILAFSITKVVFGEDAHSEGFAEELEETETPSSLLEEGWDVTAAAGFSCLLYTSPSPRDKRQSRMPSSA